MSFPAKYRGTCDLCLDTIEEGDLITSFDGGYVHDDCADDERAADRPLDVCPKCFLVKPCECDDQ